MIGRLRDERLKLQERHYFLDRVLNASPAGILTLDFDGRIELINPSAQGFLGLGAEATGERLNDFAHPLGADLSSLPVGESRVLALGGRGGSRCRAPSSSIAVSRAAF